MDVREGLRRRRWRVAALAGGGALVAALAVSSGAGANSGLSREDGIAIAQKLVNQYQQPPKWAPPGKPFDASKAKGKSIWYVSLSLSIPFEQYMAQGIKQGAALVGAKGVGFDGKFSANDAARGIRLAIQSKASVIMLGGVEPSLVAPALNDAKKAGIPVIMVNTQDP